MKRLLFLLYITAILFFLSGKFALSLDDQQVVSKSDFNIVLITIDALRADHLSCYGYPRKTSPNIDKIAEKGIIFKNAIAPSSWTVPSMASLFTSLYPINHGVILGKLVDIFRKSLKKKLEDENKMNIVQVLSDELTILPEILKIHGYTTFGVASNLLLDEKTGFARGFDYFKNLNSLPAPSVNKTIYSWEDKIKRADKFFLWLHYFDPHHPYHARTPWIEKYTTKALTRKLKLYDKKRDPEIISILKKYAQAKSNYTALYDSEINFVDSYVGELIQKFELDKNTLIIITADHGEEFLEHGKVGHGYNLYKETINVPLIIKLPNNSRKKTVEKYVNLIDIMPTILHLLNINTPKQTLGESFHGMGRNYNFAELHANETILKTIMTSEWKYIYDYYDNTEKLFNIKSDPFELNNLIDKKIKQANKLKEQLFKWVSNSKKYYPKRKAFKLSSEEKEKLKALGYIDH